MRIDADTIPALIFGTLLVVIAAIMAAYVRKSRRDLEPLLENDDRGRLHADRQFRRRIQISVLLAITGILITVGDQMDKVMGGRALLFLGWVISIFALTMWMVLLAMGDWLSTMSHTAISRMHLRNERSALEEEIRRYHAANGSQTHADSDDAIPL